MTMFTSKPPTCAGRTLALPRKDRDIRYLRPLGNSDIAEEQADAVQRLLKGEKLSVDALLPLVDGETRDPVRRDRAREEKRNEVRHKLVSIERKARSNLEEKGLETLFLALGMATWPAEDGGRAYSAPVLLIPAHIQSRGRGGEHLRLAVGGPPQLNPVLLFVLKEDHSVRVSAEAVLSECTAEDEGGHWTINHEAIVGGIETEAQGVPGFRVRPRAIVSNFSFAKMAMVEDLRRNRNLMAANPTIAAIAGHPETRRRLAEAKVDIEPTTLDERSATDDYLVLDADSTQHRVIVLACNEQNVVIQGPPGTGKSQTIANLIAQSVAEGRRVLFVAEKRAALDAVIKRLNFVGLGHLVLDLHGASVSRKEVMIRLAAALDQIRHAGSVNGADAVHGEFEARRRELNEHARRINVSRSPAGLSLNQIIGRLLRLPPEAKSTLRLRGQTLAALTRERTDELRRWVMDGAAQPKLLLGIDTSPWNDAEVRDGQTAQLVLDEVARIVDDLWPRLTSLLSTVVQQAGVRPPETLDALGSLLDVFRDVRRVRKQYSPGIFEARPDELSNRLAAAESGLFNRFWAFMTDVGYRAARSRVRALRSGSAATQTLLDEVRLAADVLRRWREFGPAGDSPQEIEAAELTQAWTAFREALATVEQVVSGEPFGGMTLASAGDRICTLAEDQRTPYRLPDIHEIRNQLRNAGLGRMLDDLRVHDVLPEHWTARFDYVWLYSILEDVLATEAGLASFNGRTHEQVVKAFRQLDRKRVAFAADRVRRLHAERAIAAMNEHYDQADLVRKEASKRSRHIPLRKLLASAPDVLTRVAPCWVASPLSVSQLIDSEQRHFDIVIFDEASQVLQKEAVPSLYRAGQVVVAGDRHQLPPPTFFATAVEGEDEIILDDDEARQTATAAIGGFESLLDTLEAFLPNLMLEWHYRSKDDRLIAFSNEHIYNRRLVTFPSARADQAIRHVLVPHDPSLGTEAESASLEVDEVVRQVIEHAGSRPDESLGVIAMGIKHANRVQAALDRALESQRDLADFFILEKEERFFVKNLETVQGDERDAIIWSTDWFFSREQEVERTVFAYEDAVRRADLDDAGSEVDGTQRASEPVPARRHQHTPQRATRLRVIQRNGIDEYSDWELQRIEKWVKSDGLNRTDKELVREMFKELPFKKMGPRIRRRLEAVSRRHRSS